MPRIRNLLTTLLLVGGALSSVAFAQQVQLSTAENSARIRGKATLQFPADRRIELAKQGTIEFWLKHYWDADDAGAFADKHFYDDAYSVVMAMGTANDLGFAVVVGAGVNGKPASSIGVVNDLKIIKDPEKLRKAMIRLETPDDFGDSKPIKLVRSKYYHVALVQRKNSGVIEIYLDGIAQGSVPATFGATGNRPLQIGWKPGTAEDGPKNFTLDADIAGLRIWGAGFPTPSINAFKAFGRIPEVRDLAMIKEYSDLLAYADFRGRGWNVQQAAWVDQGAALHIADPFAGLWRSTDFHMREHASGIMLDDPVYSFVPNGDAIVEPLSAGVSRTTYSVFEDHNYIGVMEPNGDDWAFRFGAGWTPAQFAAQRRDAAARLRRKATQMLKASSDRQVLARGNVTQARLDKEEAARNWGQVTRPTELTKIEKELKSLQVSVQNSSGFVQTGFAISLKAKEKEWDAAMRRAGEAESNTESEQIALNIKKYEANIKLLPQALQGSVKSLINSLKASLPKQIEREKAAEEQYNQRVADHAAYRADLSKVNNDVSRTTRRFHAINQRADSLIKEAQAAESLAATDKPLATRLVLFKFERFFPDGNRGSGRPSWRLARRASAQPPLAETMAFAGKEADVDLNLTRTSLDDIGAVSFNVETFEPTERQAKSANEDMTQVFLLSNNVRYRNLLYRGHNFVTMDRVNLLQPSTKADRFILEVPQDPSLFKIDSNQIRIVPLGLEIKNKNQGSTDTSSVFYSSAREAMNSGTDRLGAGFNFTVGATAGFKPFGMGADVNVSTTVNLGFQADNLTESVSLDKTSTSKIVTKSVYKHYMLHHKKDAIRLDPNFKNAVRKLASEVNVVLMERLREDLLPEEVQRSIAASRMAERTRSLPKSAQAERIRLEAELRQSNLEIGKRREAALKKLDTEYRRVFDFYDTWGTHYPLAATYGAMAWWETKIQESTAEKALKQTQDVKLMINGGEIGPRTEIGDKLVEEFKSETTTARSVGGTSAPGDNKAVSPGDEPVPIQIDLRPITDLLTPSQFPGEPEVYRDLRNVMQTELEPYIRDKQDSVLVDLALKANRGQLKVEDPSSLFSGDEITVKEFAMGISGISALDGDAGEKAGSAFQKFNGAISDMLGQVRDAPKNKPQIEKLKSKFESTEGAFPAGGFGDLTTPAGEVDVEDILEEQNRSTYLYFAPPSKQFDGARMRAANTLHPQ